MADIGDAHLIALERGEPERGGLGKRRPVATRPGQLCIISGLATGGAAPCAAAWLTDANTADAAKRAFNAATDA